MKNLRIFRSQGNCGCSGSNPASQTLVNSGQCVDPQGQAVALICDPKYLTLQAVTRMRALGVPLGGQCQQYLKKAAAGDGSGFVFMGADGQIYVERAPQLTLPILNPLDEGSYPNTGGFQFFIVGTGPDPVAWKMFAAPTVGQYTVMSENGQIILRDSTSASGNTAVCTNAAATDKGSIVTCIQTDTVDGLGNPIYALRKLTPVHQRVVVGDIDGDGVVGHKTLLDDETLQHPLGYLKGFRACTFEQLDIADDTVEGNGLPLQDAEDAGVTVEIVGYSGDTNKFYRLPARTKEELTVDGDQAVADNGTYVTMGAHALFTDKQFNYPDFFVSSVIRLGNDADNYAAIDFGLFIDGVLVHTWDVKGAKDNTLTYIHKGLVPGEHTVDIRFRQTAAAGASTVKYSSTQVFSLI